MLGSPGYRMDGWLFLRARDTTGVDPVENGIIQLAYIVEIDGKEVQSGELFSNCSGKKIFK